MTRKKQPARRTLSRHLQTRQSSLSIRTAALTEKVSISQPFQAYEFIIHKPESYDEEPKDESKRSIELQENHDLPEERFSFQEISEKESPSDESRERLQQRTIDAGEDAPYHYHQIIKDGKILKSRRCSCGAAAEVISSHRTSHRRRASVYDEDLANLERGKKTRWHTWAIARSLGDPKHFIRVSLRELLIFLLFLFLITWVVLSELNFYKYLRCSLIMDRFTKTLYRTNVSSVNSTSHMYYSMETIPDLWSFLTQHFLKVFYSYNGEEKFLKVPEGSPAVVLLSSIAVGAPRIRQVRVGKDSCVVPEMFTGWYNYCYYYFNLNYEDTQSFGPASSKVWTWRKSLGVHYYFGKVSIYSPNGYYIDLPNNFDESNDIIAGLQEERWLDRATRAVFIDFNIYSPDANLFSAIKLVMELAPGGGVIPTASCYSMKLLSLTIWDWLKMFGHPNTVGDYLILIFGIILIIYVLYFICVVIRDVSYFGWPYLFTFWGFLDVTILLFIFAAVAMLFTKEAFINLDVPQLMESINKNMYVSLDTLVALYMLYGILLGVLIILCWVKLVKFFTMFSRVSMMLTAIEESKTQLKILFYVVFMLLLGFAISGHIYFGLHVDEFNTISKSLFSIITIPTGGLYYYESMDTARPILAPLYLLAFVFTFIFILLIMFIAVLVSGTEKAEEIFALSGPYGRFGPCEYLHNATVICLTNCKCKKLARYLRRKLRLKVLKMRHSLLLALLRKYGIQGLEIKLFLERHDIRYGYDITSKKLATILTDLKTKQHLMYKETVEDEKLFEELEKLKIRLEIIDKELYDASYK